MIRLSSTRERAGSSWRSGRLRLGADVARLGQGEVDLERPAQAVADVDLGGSPLRTTSQLGELGRVRRRHFGDSLTRWRPVVRSS
jgi:hypothetical protein